jgi:hypothetical protein
MRGAGFVAASPVLFVGSADGGLVAGALALLLEAALEGAVDRGGTGALTGRTEDDGFSVRAAAG